LIATMRRPRPPYLSREVTRHRNAVWYVRRNGKRTRLRSKYGTPEFEAEYQAAIAGKAKRNKGEPDIGSLAWLGLTEASWPLPVRHDHFSNGRHTRLAVFAMWGDWIAEQFGMF